MFAFPLNELRMTSPYGPRSDGFHPGVDFGAVEGTPVFAVGSGKVEISRLSASAGEYIILNHGNGYITKYMHLSARMVNEGDTVQRGAIIGAVGNTGYSFGAHLHFQINANGLPVDPMPLLSNDPIADTIGSLDLNASLIIGGAAILALVGFALIVSA
jgi:murein DD-endopeptidase MepM/ murein hydrolase activator NlpD